MDNITKQKLIDAGRKDLVDVYEINQSGFAGIDRDGNIVDRRKIPTAVPVQENKMMGIPKPKRLPKTPFKITCNHHKSYYCLTTGGMRCTRCKCLLNDFSHEYKN